MYRLSYPLCTWIIGGEQKYTFSDVIRGSSGDVVQGSDGNTGSDLLKRGSGAVKRGDGVVIGGGMMKLVCSSFNCSSSSMQMKECSEMSDWSLAILVWMYASFFTLRRK